MKISMMSDLFKLTLLCIASEFSCSPIYTPDTHNVPLLNSSNETHLTFCPTPGIGFELLTAHSFSKHLALMANGGYFKRSEDTQSDCYRHWYGEIGTGLFFPYEKHFVYEIFSGYGLGMTKSYNFKIDSYINQGKYQRFFIQSDLGITLRIVEMAISWRNSYVSFTDFHYDGKNRPNSKGYWFYEPAITFKIGMENLKFFAQFGGSNAFLEQEIDFNYVNQYMTLGAEFAIGKKY